ncbi:MAG: endo alpha-1,4 polygalactosaminidase [Anaerolineales bacterium]|nr:endo alpha-1,4 polygalactosaminidase [Anaerolineales bacterium]
MKPPYPILLTALLLASCAPAPASVSTAFPTLAAESAATSAQPTPPIFTHTPAPAIITPPNGSWQIQYTGEINLNLDVAIYNLDLFDTSSATIADLRARGVFVMCYFSAGSREDWRPDADKFPAEVLGNDYEGWSGEKWLDIRKLDLLAPIMNARLDLASQKGCDGVDPDNIQGFTNDTGFPLSYDDQLQYNIWLSESAHARGLSIGLKNNFEQIRDLLPYFDWQLHEECFQYHECEMLLPFLEAGKPVFNIEYTLPTSEFCPQSNALGLISIRKNLILDAFIESCK